MKEAGELLVSEPSISWLQKVLHSLAVLADKNRARALSKRYNYEKDHATPVDIFSI
jgi:hypothetical protein